MGNGSIFRPEAIEAKSTDAGPGSLLKAGSTWARRAVWIVVTVFLAGLAFGLLVTIDEYAEGPARIDPNADIREVTMLLPAGRFRDLQPGIVFSLESSGRTDQIPLGTLGPVVDPEGAEIVMGKGAPQSTQVIGPVIVINGLLSDSYPEGTKIRWGHVKGRIGRERILFALVPGLKDLFTKEDDEENT